MNNLKAAREQMGLKQAELAALVQSVDSRIDVGMISRFENGVCLPTPIVARALARHLQASVRDLFSEEGQIYISTITAPETPVEPLPFEIEDLINALDTKPKTRRQLCEELDANDRNLRKLIRQARDYGYVIMNNGKGYYLSTEIDDMVVFYRREHSRAMSILQGLSGLKKHLKNLGVTI
jgi:transcriptional regulator with XRE-family HTH domain